MQRLARALSMLLVSAALSSCSVVMAASGGNDPDLGVLKAGTPRAEVEKVLTNKLEEGGKRGSKRVTYQFYTKDDPSFGRAAVYGLLDIATLGLAEVATTPIEALQGNKHLVSVTYDSNGRVARVEQRVEKAPLPKPEQALGIEGNDLSVTPAAAKSERSAPEAVLPEARARPL